MRLQKSRDHAASFWTSPILRGDPGQVAHRYLSMYTLCRIHRHISILNIQWRGTEMHSEMFMIQYRQQERELDQRLRQRLALQERLAAEEVAPSGGMILSVRFRSMARALERLRGRTRPVSLDSTCCATA